MTRYSDTPEDELVNHIIQDYENEVENEHNSISDSEFHPEAHYNHYGTRGVADLYIKQMEDVGSRVYHTGRLFEVKSEHAVENAKGANEIIEQYNRMRKYFFKDETWDTPATIRCELCFLPTPVTWRHVTENLSMYSQVYEKDPDTTASLQSRVAFRIPSSPTTALDPNTLSSPEEALRQIRPEWKQYVGLD